MLHNDVKTFQVAVDSGQIFIGDPTYIKNDFSTDFDPNKPSDKLDYNSCCHVTLKKELAGQVDGLSAVCSSTGFGDGVYPVHVYYKHGKVSKIVIKFLDED